MSGLAFEDNFDECWKDIEIYVGSMLDKITDEKTTKDCLKDIGKHIKENVKRYAPKRSEHPSYSDFKKSEYKHIVDDIKAVVRKSRTTGQYYVSVRGGKTTGYKWLWINNGHVATNGDFIQGTRFVDKAEEASQDGVNQIVDRYIKGALDNK